MRLRASLALLTLALVLLTPGAAAWAFEAPVPVDGGLSTRTSLLVAGRLTGAADGASAGILGARSLDFGDALVVETCPRDVEATVAGAGCPDGETLTGARIRLRSGAILLTPAAGAGMSLVASPGVGALGGADLARNGLDLGPALFVGGDVAIVGEGDAFVLQPLTEDVSVVVRSDSGTRDLNGTGFALRLTNAEGARVLASGGFLQLPEGARVDVAPAPLAEAERALAPEALHVVMRALVPPDVADRRADLVDAFGPFQVVPALLNGVVAASVNLSLDGTGGDGFVLLRVSDAHAVAEGDAWRLSGNASATVQGRAFSPDAGAPGRTPFVVPVLLAVGAVAAWAWTRRDEPPRRARWRADLARVVAFALLAALAATTAAGLLGVNAFTDAAALSWRSRAQLLLLALVVAGLATTLVGVSTTSLARSAFAWRGRTQARLWPLAAGLVAAALLVLLATPALVTLAARLVRL